MVDLIHGALAPAIPDRIIAACNGACVSSTFSGVNPRTGRFYVYLETIGGGFGARATKDGLDGVHVHITNTSNLPVEALEAEYPLVVERYELVEDSGGPGTWRGGLGTLRARSGPRATSATPSSTARAVSRRRGASSAAGKAGDAASCTARASRRRSGGRASWGRVSRSPSSRPAPAATAIRARAIARWSGAILPRAPSRRLSRATRTASRIGHERRR